MKALKQKWKSCQGASILLAMLFLLVCMMAAASIVMAAASDAGKIQSNKQEQQKYLTLESALTLLCDDLERVEYVGQYKYHRVKCEETKKDADGNEILDGEGNRIIEHEWDHEYERLDGILQRRSDLADSAPAPWGLEEELLEPMRERLDFMFAKHFIVLERQKYVNDGYPYEEKWDPAWGDKTEGPPASFTLELELTAGEDSGDYGGLADKVKVLVELRADGSILMTATLWEQGKADGGVKTWSETKYKMTAVLRPDPDKWPEQRLVLRNIDADECDEKDEETGERRKDDCQTEPIRWTLDCFVKGEG